jgi:hypothetical protein
VSESRERKACCRADLLLANLRLMLAKYGLLIVRIPDRVMINAQSVDKSDKERAQSKP